MEAILEGILFLVGDEGISYERLEEVLGIDNNKLNDLVETLKDDYAKSNRGIKLEMLGNNLKLTTKKEHKEYYEKLVEVENNTILSQAALETLAIIAYNGPITRVRVDEIRGINSSHIVRKLVLRNLIKDMGKSDSPGRPILYGVTNDFLDYFGLKSIDDLPKVEEIEFEESETDLFKTKYSEE